ncbi:tryptophan synthase subunit alpha [Teredinibacter waterburyi]|uniref:tryptophan synthase subunit alpha n=1 Tax=Teredinibacter waterburyi TaxID=1500538 RepID=UPI00165F59C2|nr:tryptophan synthase subunit alpha [Teredinibacter waterburyi]
MTRYGLLFENLKRKQEGAFVPFVMLGDPGIEQSFEIICTLIDAGADALELGFPFSDPIADGPTIQKSALRALKHNTTPDQCFEIIAKVRARYSEIPIGLLLYSNLVMKRGLAEFYQAAHMSGVDSVLLADVPFRESEPFREQAKKNKIDHILIAAPNADEKALANIASSATGYIYMLGRAGVTGAENQADCDLSNTLGELLQKKATPSLIGFGISRPEQIKNYLLAGAAGVIAGSATVNIIEKHETNAEVMHRELALFCQAMKAATKL